MPRNRCLFAHNGKPTTLPGTEDDAKRIALSVWITAMLVRHGDEQPGEYVTPGTTGYTPIELRNDEWIVLRERLTQLRERTGQLKTEIDSILKSK